MSKQAALLTVLVLGGGGYAVYANWEDISRKLGLGDLSPDHIRAVDLAKSARTLDRYTTNYEVIRERVRQEKLKVEGEGWVAEHRSGQRYEVRFAYTDPEWGDGAYVFLVDIGSRDVVLESGAAPR